MYALTTLGNFGLTGHLTLERYRFVMSYPMWNYFMQAVVSTRSYEPGLDGFLLLLRFTEDKRADLSKQEYTSNLMKLYGAILRMLDKLDRWEEYLETWNRIMTNTKLELTYAKGSQAFHRPHFEQFILREDASLVYVHFLWGGLHRKELIERKLARKLKGKKLGNLLHRSQSELSKEEIQRRFEWVVKIAEISFREGRFSGLHRQRESR